MANSNLLRGVEGWLAFLVAILIALAPLSGLSGLMQELGKAEVENPNLLESALWQQYKTLSWGVLVLTSSISIAAGYRLWKVHFANSVRFAIVALWLIGPVRFVGATAVLWFLFGSEVMFKSLPELIGPAVAACIAAGVWTAYLNMSVRVKNTYVVPIQGAVQT